MGGFTGNDAGVRKVLVAFMGLMSFAAWRRRRRARREALALEAARQRGLADRLEREEQERDA